MNVIRERRLMPALLFVFATAFAGFIACFESKGIFEVACISGASVMMLLTGKLLLWPRAILQMEGDDLVCHDLRHTKVQRIPMASISEIHLRETLDCETGESYGFKRDFIVTTAEGHQEIELVNQLEVSDPELLSIVIGWILQATNHQVPARFSGPRSWKYPQLSGT